MAAATYVSEASFWRAHLRARVMLAQLPSSWYHVLGDGPRRRRRMMKCMRVASPPWSYSITTWEQSVGGERGVVVVVVVVAAVAPARASTLPLKPTTRPHTINLRACQKIHNNHTRTPSLALHAQLPRAIVKNTTLQKEALQNLIRFPHTPGIIHPLSVYSASRCTHNLQRRHVENKI